MASVQIDKEKLNRLIEQRGLTKSDASREIGYHSNFISDCCSRGKMNMPAVKMLERTFNIKLEEYQLAEKTAGLQEEVEKAEQETAIKDMKAKELSELIYKAVYSAVKHAWENDEE